MEKMFGSFCLFSQPPFFLNVCNIKQSSCLGMIEINPSIHVLHFQICFLFNRLHGFLMFVPSLFFSSLSTFKCEEVWGFFLTSQENLSSRNFILYLLCFIPLQSLRASQGLFSVQGFFFFFGSVPFVRKSFQSLPVLFSGIKYVIRT